MGDACLAAVARSAAAGLKMDWLQWTEVGCCQGEEGLEGRYYSLAATVAEIRSQTWNGGRAKCNRTQ